MPSASQQQALVTSLLGTTQAKYPDSTRVDVMAALAAFVDLQPKSELFEFPNRVRKTALALDGTVPVSYRGSTYNIPVCLYLWDTHPYHAPVCFVRPTRDMMVKPSSYVDQQGKIYLPYLAEWKHPGYDLQGLLQVIAVTFEDNCPVFATGGGGGAAAASRQPATSSGYTPYPTSGAYNMPQPGGGAAYNPYQSQASTTPYPPASTATGNSSPYPAYQAYGGGGYNPYTVQQSGQQAAASPSAYSSQGSGGSAGGTIQPEHIRASLLSGIEDRLRRRLRETLGTKYAELESIRRTREDLNVGEARLRAMLARLSAEQSRLENAQIALQDRKAELARVLADVPADADLDVDTAVETRMPLHRQLLRQFVNDNTVEDTIYYLGQALKKGQLDLDSYLKHVRKLSRTQFTARATMHKCRAKAGLSV